MASSRPQLTGEGLHLPTDIIQHIQSFLDDDAAIRTTLLSKPWYNAWSTGPILYFVENPRFCNSTFWDFVTKKMHKYKNLNIKIDRLELELGFDSGNECDDNDNDGVVKDESYFASLVDKLIDDALSLRVNVLDISLGGVLRYSNAIRSKVFSHRYLRELCLVRCQVHCPGKVICSDLVCLGLHDVSIHESTFKNILAGCPKIEELVLFEGVKALKSINASELQNLNTLMVGNALRSTLGICGQFLNLRRLLLNYIVVYDSFFKNLSSNFPKLEDLALEHLRYYYMDIKISSHSIKRLSLKHPELRNKAYFDVPNIEKFKFYGCHIPHLSFNASSNEWKSEIIVSNDGGIHDVGITDLSKLRELLIKLGRSEITLRLNVGSGRNVGPGRNIGKLRLPAVEKMTYVMRFGTAYNLFVDCLLISRP